MNRLLICCTFALIFILPISAQAYWVDYGKWWGNSGPNNICRPGYTQKKCQPPTNIKSRNLECRYFFPTKACCCEGLVWAPDRPTVNTSIVKNSIDITWNQDQWATQYTLWWSTNSDVRQDDSHKINVSGNSYRHKNLKFNTNYYYILKATNKYGGSSTYFYGGKTGLAPKPYDIRAISQMNKVILSWNAPSSAKEFNIYWSTHPKLSVSNYEGKIDGVTGKSFTHSTIEPGIQLDYSTTYYYIITAIDSNGYEGPASNIISVKTEVMPLDAVLMFILD